MAWTAAGTWGAAACANALNQVRTRRVLNLARAWRPLLTAHQPRSRQILEIRNDSLMKRTHRRPLPAGAISRHHAIAFAVCAGVSGVAILYTKVRALAQRLHAICAGLTAVRHRRVAGQSHNRRAGGCQYRAVRCRVHPAEADKRREHLGGCRGGRHPAAHGLGRRCRQAGAWRWGAFGSAVLLADAALHGACVLVPHGLRGWRVRAHHPCVEFTCLAVRSPVLLTGIACCPSSTPRAAAPPRWRCATRCTWCRWGSQRAPWASPLPPLHGKRQPFPLASPGALQPSTPAARKHQPGDCFCSAWSICQRFSWLAWCIACQTRRLRARRRRLALRSGALGSVWGFRRARSRTTTIMWRGRARQLRLFPCRCPACRFRAPRELPVPKTTRRRLLQQRQSRGALRDQLVMSTSVATISPVVPSRIPFPFPQVFPLQEWLRR